jgi:surface antigen
VATNHTDQGDDMHIRKTLAGRAVISATLGVALSTFVLATTSPAAHAASGDRGRINRATAMRACADTRCGSLRTAPSGASVPVWCWRDGGSDLGTVRWFRVTYNGTKAFVSANAVSNPQPAVPYCSDMQPGDTLFANQSVWSPDGRFRLTMQGDGNLVEYGPGGAWWSTMTAGSGGTRFVQQGDGNGVVYSSSRAVWANMTMNSGAYLNVQSDGNIVTYIGGTALYATSQHRTFGQLRSPAAANPGAAGNCTWWAEEQIKNYMKRGAYPAWGGDAGWWNDNAPRYGWAVQSMPTSHAIVVFEPNTNGARGYGHVAWADAVQARSDGVYVHITEMNWVGFNKVSDRWIRHQAGLSYIPAPSL